MNFQRDLKFGQDREEHVATTLQHLNNIILPAQDRSHDMIIASNNGRYLTAEVKTNRGISHTGKPYLTAAMETTSTGKKSLWRKAELDLVIILNDHKELLHIFDAQQLQKHVAENERYDMPIWNEKARVLPVQWEDEEAGWFLTLQITENCRQAFLRGRPNSYGLIRENW